MGTVGADGTAEVFLGAWGGADGATLGGGLKAVFCVPDDSG